MKSLSVKISERLDKRLQKLIEEGRFSSKSDAVRNILYNFFMNNGKKEANFNGFDETDEFSVIRKCVVEFLERKKKNLTKEISLKTGIKKVRVAVILNFILKTLKENWC